MIDGFFCDVQQIRFLVSVLWITNPNLSRVDDWTVFLSLEQDSLTKNNLWSTTNVIVVSDHGMADVPLETNWFFIDDFVNMESIETVVNSGAFMMIYPYKGHEHQVHFRCKRTTRNSWWPPLTFAGLQRLVNDHAPCKSILARRIVRSMENERF